jgi:hypothetical protein
MLFDATTMPKMGYFAVQGAGERDEGSQNYISI